MEQDKDKDKELEQVPTEDLLIEESSSPVLDEDFEQLQPIVEDFVDSYEKNQDIPVEEWLCKKLQSELPDRSQSEVETMSKEIVESIRYSEACKESLSHAIADGRSRESWLAEKVAEGTSRMSAEQTVQYLQGLDNAVNKANDALWRTITTKAGAINQNPSLNGFIAEQEHVQSFNMNAQATGSEYRAKVLEPDGQYGKNSVDIVIVDKNDRIVRRYQSKYCRNADATQKAFEDGNYRGQRSLVPSDQVDDIGRKATDHLEAPDGTRSNPLSKTEAVDLQKEAQSGNWNPKNWNHYKTKDIAIGIGKQTGYSALMGAAIGAGSEVAGKLIRGEKIEGKEVVKKAVTTGADFGVKAALSGALKAGAEKGIIKCIPKGTPAGLIANVVFVGVENAKILYKYGKGEISGDQAFAKIEETTTSAVGGLMAMGYGVAKGAAIGASIGGPVGAAIGGFIGGTVAYMAGSAAGTAIAKARRNFATATTKAAISVAKSSFAKTISAKVSAFTSTCKSAISSLKFW